MNPQLSSKLNKLYKSGNDPRPIRSEDALVLLMRGNPLQHTHTHTHFHIKYNVKLLKLLMVWPLPLNTNITHLTWACHTNVAQNNKPHSLAAASVLLPGLHYNAPTGAQSRLLYAGQPSAWVSGNMTGNGTLHDARSKRRGSEGASSRVTLFPFLQGCRMVSSVPADVAMRATQQLQEALPGGRTPWSGRARNAQEPHEFCGKTSSASKRLKLAKAARSRSLHSWSANVAAGQGANK